MLAMSAYGCYEMLKTNDAPNDISLLGIIMVLIAIFTPVLNSVLALVFGIPLIIMFLEEVRIPFPKKKGTK